MDTTSLIRSRWLLSAVTASLVVFVGLMLYGTAHATVPPGPVPQCTFPDAIVCISLDPDTDTNDTGTNHTVTASVTRDDGAFQPSDGVIEVAIIVFDGPNTYDDPDNLDALTAGAIDENGQLSLTYAGDGGPGTDTIGAVACLEEVLFPDGAAEASGLNGSLCGVAIDSFIDLCFADLEACLFDFTDSEEGECAEQFVVFCDTATKEWVEPAPAPTASPTATPVEAAPAAQLPATGSYPTGGSGSPLAGTIALALGGLAILAGGVALVRRAVAT